MSEQYSYSSDEERFDGCFDSREAAIEEAKAEGLKYFWTGKNRPPRLEPYCLRADGVIESILNDEEDFACDWADGWPGETKEQRDELTAILQAAFQDWIVRHNLKPTFFVVEDVQEHLIEESEEATK